MAEIVNLRQARKQRGRAEAKQAAAENRIRHGRTGPAKAEDKRVQDRAAKDLDGKRRD